MATLFFDGFDRGTTLNKLDNTYWSTQFTQYPKYSLAGYRTNLDVVYDGGSIFWQGKLEYAYVSPNNGILPKVGFVSLRTTPWYDLTLRPNSYPGLGAPAGFLALSNIEVETMGSSFETPTFLRLSGFPVASGNQVYGGMRVLGLETKHTEYSEYPHRHKLLSLCSGDINLLDINIVKIDNNDQLLSVKEYTTQGVWINDYKTTLGLEIQQNNVILGTYDLNLSNILNDYKVRSVFSTGMKILTITNQYTDTAGFNNIMSRWVHLEWLVDNSDPEQSVFSLRTEGLETTLINEDQEITRDGWETQLPISGFNFDNIRFYNRTYSSSILSEISSSPNYYHWSIDGSSENIAHGSGTYYTLGKVWVLDDVTLIDNIGAPSYWLGPTSKVLPLEPKINSDGSITDGSRPDVAGLNQWDLYSSSVKNAFLRPDADSNYISATNSGLISTAPFGTRAYQTAGFDGDYNNSPKGAWREQLNDAIGGMKIYDSARKSYLDTKFVNVFRSGINDPYNTSILIKPDFSEIKDLSRYRRSIVAHECVLENSIPHLANYSIGFSSDLSYFNVDHITDLGTSPFTIESWVYMSQTGQPLTLFSKRKDPNYMSTSIYLRSAYEFILNHDSVEFIKVYGANGENLPEAGIRTKAYFTQNISIDTWSHVAVVRPSGTQQLVCYLNGVASTGYQSTYYSPSNDALKNVNLPSYGTLTQGVFTITTDYGSNNLVATTDSVQNLRPYVGYNLDYNIENYRVTLGTARYSGNFTPPTSSFYGQTDDYVNIGPIHNVLKTSYRNYEYYSNKNPATNNNWTVAQISGLVFGVKKL